MTSTDFWGKIESATGKRETSWFRAGRYILAIDKFEGRETRKKTPAAFLEMTVLHVVDDAAAAMEKDGPHRVGDKVTWFFGLQHDGAWDSLKSALAKIAGVAIEDVTKDVCKELASSDQPLRGMAIETDGRVMTTKGKGLPINMITVKRVVEKAEVESMMDPMVLKSLKVTLV